MSSTDFKRQTVFSPDRLYRYTLWREWDCDLLTGCADDLPHASEYLMVVGLNPSTADETLDDPTIRRCIGFAKAWGFGALCMTNLFAWRDTDPAAMKRAKDPVGADNDAWLNECSIHAGKILAAWGNGGAHLDRAARVIEMLPPMECLKKNSDGSPKHPLYALGNSQTIPFP